jgi:hypothetical protein
MRRELSLALAGAFLAGPWTRPGLVVSGSVVLRRRADWLPALVRAVLEVYPSPPLDAPRELAAVIATRQVADGRGRPRSRPVAATRMLRNPWHLPVLHGLDDVARMLRLDAGELEWFADGRHLARGVAAPPLQHYRVTTRLAPSGAVRVLEAPKPRLKALQRLLLARVLHGVPPHDAAHGFQPGRSVATFAAPHAGQGVVLRMDLEGFFASVSAGRVYGILRTAGYPEPVAHCLAGVFTTVLPRSAWARVPRPADELLEAHWRLGRRLAVPHLPQGAPTSPALANLAAHRLDVRLTALAQSWGGAYTRYADDLALSGARLGAGDVAARRRGGGDRHLGGLPGQRPQDSGAAASRPSGARRPRRQRAPARRSGRGRPAQGGAAQLRALRTVVAEPRGRGRLAWAPDWTGGLGGAARRGPGRPAARDARLGRLEPLTTAGLPRGLPSRPTAVSAHAP